MPSKFNVASCLCRPNKQDVVFEDNAVNKSVWNGRPPRFHEIEMPIEEHIHSVRTQKTMSSSSQHDNNFNVGDVAPELQTNDQQLTTNVDTADPMEQTKVLTNKNPSSTKQVLSLVDEYSSYCWQRSESALFLIRIKLT